MSFLEIDNWYPDSFEQINASKGYKNMYLKRLADLIPYYKKKLGIQFNFNLGLWKKLNNFNNTVQKRKPISDGFRKELTNYFEHDVKLLSKLLNRDLSGEWKFKT